MVYNYEDNSNYLKNDIFKEISYLKVNKNDINYIEQEE